MRNLVPSRMSEFDEEFASLRLAGFGDGIDSCAILISRVPPGHRGPRLHTHPSDQFYFVVEGRTTVQIGAETFEVPPLSLVRFPAGVPHCNWNATDEYETHVEVIVPRPPEEQIIAYYDGEPPVVPGAADLIRPLKPDDWTDRPFSSQQLAMREWGSQHCRIYAARVGGGVRGPALHFHDFDQFYFILKGSFAVRVGHEVHSAKAGDLVVLPRGVVHENWNASDEEEMHLTIIVPEPEDGTQFDYKVDVKYDARPPFT